MRARWALVGAAIGLVAAMSTTSDIDAVGGLPRTGSELYQRIEIAAANGDQRAAAALAAIDEYMATRGLSPDDLGVPALDVPGRESNRGLVTLRVDDLGPWSLTVHNATVVSSADELHAYIAAREAALTALANNSPNRQLRVVLAPASAVSLESFARSLSCPCSGVSVTVDVYTNDGWLMLAGRDISGLEVSSESQVIERAIRADAALTLDIYPGISADDLTFRVRSLTVDMQASAAVETANADGVLAVDPLTDLGDLYAGRAAFIEVSGAPDLREADVRLSKGQPLDEDPVWPTFSERAEE